MADMIDVGNMLVQLLAGVVYPNGTAAPSVSGMPVAVYQGWPNPATIDADMTGTGKRIHLTVWPTAIERTTESFASALLPFVIVDATIQASITGNVATITGTATPGQNICLAIDGATFTHTVQAGDTPTSIATALATSVSAVRAASNAGPVITVPGARTMSAASGGSATMVQLLERVERVFMVTVWAPTPADRDALAKAVDSALRATVRAVMADGTAATLRYRAGGGQYDNMQKSRVWRRDINYAVEFLVTGTAAATQVVSTQLSVSAQVALANGATAQISQKTFTT